MVIQKTDGGAFWLKEPKILFGANVDLIITGYKNGSSVGNATYTVNDRNGTAKLVTLTSKELTPSIFQNVDSVTVTCSNYNGTPDYDGRLDTVSVVMTESITVGDPVLPDTTAPVLSAVSVSDQTDSTAILHFTSNEAGTYYYLVYAASDAAPSAENIRAQGNAVTKGSDAAFSDGNTVSLSGLIAATAYRVYVVEVDSSNNLSEVASVSFSTSPTAGVAAQSGALTASTPGSATYVVTPKAFTNNASLTGDNYAVKWYANAAGTTGEISTAPTGVTMTKTDAATLTASIDATAQAGTYYFCLTAADNTVTPAETATSNVAILTVAKPSYTPVPSSKTVLIYNGGVRTGSVSLNDLLTSVPSGAIFGSITPPTSPQVLSTLAVNDTDTGKLDYTSLNNASDATASDTYTVNITSTDYQDITVDLIFTATPKTAVTITGLSAPANRSYTGTPVASDEFGTPSVTGQGELDSSLVYTYSATGSTVYGPTAAAPTNAGTYQLTVSVPTGNQIYTGSKTVSFTISPAAVTVEASTAHITKVYDGTVDAAVGTPVSSVGNIAAAGYDYLYTGRNGTTYQSADTPKNAGGYTLTVSIKDSNLLYTGHMTVDFSISKATVTVPAASNTAQVDDPVPSLATQNYTVSALVVGDSLLTAPTLTYAATPDMTRPGTVAIKASGAAAGDNYTLVYTDGLLTVNARPQINFQSNGGSAVASAAAQKNGTVAQPVAPTREGYTFLGWYADAALTRGWNFASDTATADMTLYAKWAAATTYAVSGTVSTAGTPVSGAMVCLMRGSVEYRRATTASDGSYHLADIALGVYNAVATSGDVTQTVLITVANSDLTNQNIQMPSGDVNSLLELTGTATLNVVVGGLDAEANAVAAQQGGTTTTVVVKMTVEQKAESALTDVPATKAEVSAIKSSLIASPDRQLHFEFLEISVTKAVGTDATAGTTTKMGTISHMLEIVIPYDTTGKANIRILQYHEGEGVRPFTEDTARGGADGTFYIDTAAQQIHLFTKKFSTYAISYETALPVTPAAPVKPAVPTAPAAPEGTVPSPATGDDSDLFLSA